MSAKPIVKDEEWVKAQIKKILKQHSIYYFMPAAGRFGKAGVPDFICCYDGVFIGIEAKGTGGKATDIQKNQLRKIKAAKGLALIINERNYLKLHDLFSREFKVVIT